MDNQSFEALKVAASIAPTSANWPKPDFSKVSLEGDKPHLPAGDLHWSALHDAVEEARSRTLRVLGSMAAIDEDKSLSPSGKADEKRKVAEAALAALEKSKALTKAQAAVECKFAEWNKQLTPKPGDAAIAAEIRSHLKQMAPAERVAFIDAHAGEVGAAVLSAPAFLSGLSPAELNTVKQRIEMRLNPEIAKSKDETLAALSHTEQGWRNAATEICARAGLPKGHNGAEEAA